MGTRFNVGGLIMLPWSLSYLFEGYATTACNLSLENETTNGGRTVEWNGEEANKTRGNARALRNGTF